MRNIFYPALTPLLFLLTLGCSGSSNSLLQSTNTMASQGLVNAIQPLNTPTYDGSGQAMHPGVVVFGSSWHGFSYWMSVTPYPNSNAAFENPSIIASNDGKAWVVPAGLTNPLAFPTGAHFDDADLFHDAATDELWIYYLEEDNSGKTHVRRQTASDGINWNPAEDVLSVPNYQIISPAIERLGSGYGMWYVNAGTLGCSAKATTVEVRTSENGVAWSGPATANLSQDGYVIWHIDVAYIESKKEFWAVYAAWPSGTNCGKTSLFLATSNDGFVWHTFRKPLLGPGRSGSWDQGKIYRSTVWYEPKSDLIRLWYSATSSADQWHTGYTEAKLTSELDFLDKQ